MLESNVEREKEMERLRKELIDATKVARELFDVTVKSNKVDVSNKQIQYETTALNEVYFASLFRNIKIFIKLCSLKKSV